MSVRSKDCWASWLPPGKAALFSAPFPLSFPSLYGSKGSSSLALTVQSLPSSHPQHHLQEHKVLSLPASPASCASVCGGSCVAAERSCVQVTASALRVLHGWAALSVLVNPPHLHTPQTPVSLCDVTRLTTEIHVLTQMFSCASQLHQNHQQRTDVIPLA